MSEVGIAQSDVLNAVRVKDARWSKKRYKLGNQSARSDMQPGREVTQPIHFERSNGQWRGVCGEVCVIDDTLDAAFYHLCLKLRLSQPSRNDLPRIGRTTRAASSPTCEILKFEVHPTVDHQTEYNVSFLTNASLHRGDFELLVCAGLRVVDQPRGE